MHRQRPDFTFSGTAREVGLDPVTETAPNSHRFVIPETTLGELAARVKKVRGDDAIRVVGDPNAKVSRIATGAGMATPAVNAPDVDVVIGGEQREIEGTFDSPEYVMDAATLGVPKGWIIIGHNMSEESGMQEMADWLRPIVPEVKVQHVRAGNVYWVPKSSAHSSTDAVAWRRWRGNRRSRSTFVSGGDFSGSSEIEGMPLRQLGTRGERGVHRRRRRDRRWVCTSARPDFPETLVAINIRPQLVRGIGHAGDAAG